MVFFIINLMIIVVVDMGIMFISIVWVSSVKLDEVMIFWEWFIVDFLNKFGEKYFEGKVDGIRYY